MLQLFAVVVEKHIMFLRADADAHQEIAGLDALVAQLNLLFAAMEIAALNQDHAIITIANGMLMELAGLMMMNAGMGQLIPL